MELIDHWRNRYGFRGKGYVLSHLECPVTELAACLSAHVHDSIFMPERGWHLYILDLLEAYSSLICADDFHGEGRPQPSSGTGAVSSVILPLSNFWIARLVRGYLGTIVGDVVVINR